MKVKELMEKLFAWCDDAGPHDYANTCDTLKAGDPESEVQKAAVTMFATPEVIRAARDWGAQLIVTHEPTFYDHMDVKMAGDPVTAAKEQLLRESGLAVWRFHDHPHVKRYDLISEGGVRALGLEGEWINGGAFGRNRFRLAAPLTAREVGRRIEKGMGAARVRVCGAVDAPCQNLGLCFGSPGELLSTLRRPDVDILLVGEACEWQVGEYARDAAQLGFNKALIIIGHVASEKEGMRLLAERLPALCPGVESRYFECGEAWVAP